MLEHGFSGCLPRTPLDEAQDPAAHLLMPALCPLLPQSYAPGSREEALVYLNDGLSA